MSEFTIPRVLLGFSLSWLMFHYRRIVGRALFNQVLKYRRRQYRKQL